MTDAKGNLFVLVFGCDPRHPVEEGTTRSEKGSKRDEDGTRGLSSRCVSSVCNAKAQALGTLDPR